MSDLDAMGKLFKSIFEVWNTPVSMPIIGDTSFFKISIALGMMIIIIGLINRLYGGDGDE